MHNLMLALLNEHLINITPTPGFPWFKRLDDRMMRLMVMPGGMFILRAVTTANVSTNQADSQVHPFIPHFETFFTPLRAGFNLSNLIEMITSLFHRMILFNGIHPCFIPLPRAFIIIPDNIQVYNPHLPFNKMTPD
jgi:hypothetical protein